MSELPLWRVRLYQSANPLHPVRSGESSAAEHDDDEQAPAHIALEGLPLILQSAVIPYRCTPDAVEILLVTSRKKGKWIVPKGLLITGMAPADSAVKEALEEAGVGGIVRFGLLGTVVRERRNSICRTQIFAMEVTEVYNHWKEMESRARRWVTFAEAEQILGDTRMWECFQRLAACMEQAPR